LVVNAEIASKPSETLIMGWEAEDLLNLKYDPLNLNKKADPYLIFYKKKSKYPEKIFKTEFVLDSLNPTFKTFNIKSNFLCEED
jgi:hypothetical protein